MEDSSNEVKSPAESSIIRYSTEFKEYSAFKLFPSAVLSSSITASYAYLNGFPLMRYTALGFVGAALYTTSYCMGTFCLKNIRNDDDIINHTVIGAANGAIFAKGFFITNRATLLGLTIGGVTGLVYKGVGDVLFSSTREMWLEHRANRELHSKHKTLLVRKSRMVTFEQVQDEQARQSARRKLQQEAEKIRAERGPIRKLETNTSKSNTHTHSNGDTSVDK